MWNNIEDMILYEDRDIIVCHKVAGIAVQSARIGMPDMESTLKNYLASKKNRDNAISGDCSSSGSAGGRGACFCKK